MTKQSRLGNSIFFFFGRGRGMIFFAPLLVLRLFTVCPCSPSLISCSEIPSIAKKKALLCLLKFFRLAPDSFPHKLLGHELVAVLESSPDLVRKRVRETFVNMSEEGGVFFYLFPFLLCSFAFLLFSFFLFFLYSLYSTLSFFLLSSFPSLAFPLFFPFSILQGYTYASIVMLNTADLSSSIITCLKNDVHSGKELPMTLALNCISTVAGRNTMTELQSPIANFVLLR